MQEPQPNGQRQALRDYIHTTLLGGRAVDDDEELLLSGMVDSLGVMSLVSFVEQTFNIKVPLEDVTLENLCSIEAISTYADSQRIAAS